MKKTIQPKDFGKVKEEPKWIPKSKDDWIPEGSSGDEVLLKGIGKSKK